jgi:replicative DNA helicase
MTGPKRAARGLLRPVPEPDRQPPHNLEAEEAVLGVILASGRLLAEVAALVEEADLYRPAHRTIWRAILRLADRGEPTDPITVLGGAGASRRARRRRGRPVPAHPG